MLFSLQEPLGIARRLKLQSTLRLSVAFTLCFFTLVFQPGLDAGILTYEFFATFLMTLVHFGVCIFFFLSTRLTRVLGFNGYAYLQIVYDVLFSTILIYLTGGIESEFKLMYALSIFSSSFLMFKMGAILCSVLSALFYTLLINLLFSRQIPMLFSNTWNVSQWSFHDVSQSMMLNVIVFLVLGFVAAKISEQLRQSQARALESHLQVEQLKDLMAHMLSSLQSGIFVLNEKDEVLFWNEHAQKITGIERMQMIGKNIQDVFYDFKKRSNENKSDSFEMDFFKFDQVRYLKFSKHPLLDNAQLDIKGVLYTFEDLTEIKELEQKASQAKHLMALSHMSSRMAHEIRNPLTAIYGAAQILTQECKLSEENQTLLNLVQKETERLNSLLSKFLDYSKELRFDFAVTDFSQLLSHTVALFQKGKDQLNINASIEPGLILKANANELSQLVWNLLENASEAMGHQGQIDVALYRSGEKIEFQIKDRGHGISDDIKEKIFDPFFTTKPKGNGLGLSVVSKVVNHHQAHLEIQSTKNQGSVFTIHFSNLASNKEVVVS